MKYLKLYEEFAILESNRQDLYHVTYRLMDIIESDLLKMGTPAYDHKDKSISVTRSNMYACDSEHFDQRLLLDTNLLLRQGYRAYPVDELGIASGKSKKNVSKANYLFRKPQHNLDLPDDFMDKSGNAPFHIEYEERFYSDIKNIGKYIKFIDLYENKFNYIITSNTNKYASQNEYSKLIDYLEKYPHIKIRVFGADDMCRPKRTLTLEEMKAEAETRKLAV